MRRARRNRLLVLLLLLTGQTGQPPVSGPEAGLRASLTAADEVRALFGREERAALTRQAQALAEENRLLADDAAALEDLRRADAAVADAMRLARETRDSVAAARARVVADTAALTVVPPAGAPEEEIAALYAARDAALAASDDARRLADSWTTLAATAKAAAGAVARLADTRAARDRIASGLAESLRAARARRDAAMKAAADAAARAAAEASHAGTLREMLAILESQRQLEEAQAREEVRRAESEKRAEAVLNAKLRQAATGRPAGPGLLTASTKPARQLRAPVAGVLLKRWGDPEDGQRSNGQSWRTAPAAAVAAPCAGTVAFAAPFRTFGPLIVLDCGGGYHAVLSGMQRLSVAAGQTVRPGDTAGTMPAAPDGRPGVLYMELRKAGRPVDPAPWLPAAAQ